jgi:hypothetical protein
LIAIADLQADQGHPLDASRLQLVRQAMGGGVPLAGNRLAALASDQLRDRAPVAAAMMAALRAFRTARARRRHPQEQK